MLDYKEKVYKKRKKLEAENLNIERSPKGQKENDKRSESRSTKNTHMMREKKFVQSMEFDDNRVSGNFGTQ